MPHPIILHHFDRSPFSEKIRVVFGHKGLSWKSVRIPQIMPKPDLMPLTGGYRRTPVMQIGATCSATRRSSSARSNAAFRRRLCFPRAEPASLGRSARGPTAPSFRTPSLSYLELSGPRSLKLSRRSERAAWSKVRSRQDAGGDPQMRDQLRAQLGWDRSAAQ